MNKQTSIPVLSPHPSKFKFLFSLLILLAGFSGKATTYTVTNTNSTGAGSFDAAVTACANGDIVVFNFSSGSAPFVINLSGTSVISASNITIKGQTTNGYTTGNPVVRLDGSVNFLNDLLQVNGSGVTIIGLSFTNAMQNAIAVNGNNCTIQNCFIGLETNGTTTGDVFQGIYANGVSGLNVDGVTFGHNVIVTSGNPAIWFAYNGSTGCTGASVTGNYMGVNAAGTSAVGSTAYGVYFDFNSTGNTIGGAGSARNVISGCSNYGIYLGAGSNVIKGNIIGLNAAGTAAIGNFYGVYNLANANTIGGTGAGEGNIISGNISDGIVLDGFSGAKNAVIVGNYIGINAAGTSAIGNSGAGINCTGNSGGSTGHVIGGTTSSARNIISGNASNGILISQAPGTTVRGNYIGLNAAGTASLANGSSVTTPAVGISSSTGVIIGGTAAGAGNVISGNKGDGISVSSGSNPTIQGNYIGLAASGLTAIGNGRHGISLAVTVATSIGGNTLPAGNYISGNTTNGINITSTGAHSIAGNFIGLNISNTAVPNGNDGVFINGATPTFGVNGAGNTNYICGNTKHGVEIAASSVNLINCSIGVNSAGTTIGNGINGVNITSGSNNTIGSLTSGSGNVISGNIANGIVISGATGNRVSGNSIYNNGSLGIDLANNGVTANDAGDGDTGSNNLQNYPVITSVDVVGGNTIITGTLNSTASTTFNIEFFKNTVIDPSGYGEGEIYLGTQSTSTDASGNATFTFTTAGNFHLVSATATNANNTSEFSRVTQQEIAVSYTGTNIPDGSITPFGIDSTSIGYPVVRTYKIQNLGAETLNLSGLTLPAGFSLVGTLPSTVAGTSTVNLQIQLDALANGTYSGTVSFTNDDSDENPFNFVIKGWVGCVAIPAPTITVVDNCDGSSDLTASGYTGNLLWSTGATSATIHVTNAATYTVTQTINGCVGAVGSATSAPRTAPTLSVNSGVICTGQSFTIVPSGASTYTYSSGSNVVNPLTDQTYSVTGTSAQGCIATNTAVSSVTVNTTPTVSVNSGAICTGQSFTMIPSGASTYTYSSGSNVVNPLTDQTYSVTGTNAQGCVATNTAISTVTVNTTPTVSVNSGVICTGQSFTMVPSGANTYTYSSGTDVVNPLTLTNYSVTGTAANGCVATNTAVSTVTVNTTPTVSVNSGVICTGQSFTMVPSGANTYTYSSGSNIVSPLTLTNYSVTGTAANGCVATNTAISTVTVNTTPTVSVNSGVICTGQSFTMVPSGASTYTYSSGTNIVSPLTLTSYSVTGTAANGCVATNTAISTVTVNTTPTISVNSGVICTGQSFTMVPSGASTYTYSSGTNIVSPLTLTSYSVTGTSAQGCIATNTAVSTITVNTTPTISVNSGVICTGQSFTMVPTGATTYTYSSGTNIVSPLTLTSYSVTGTAANGCLATNTAVSTVTVNITPTVSVNNGVICTGQSFTIAPSGASTYTYSSGGNVVSPLTLTSYSVTGTAANGCVATNTAISTVTVNTTPTVSVNSGVICTGQSFTIVPSGANTYTYSSGSNVVSPLTDQTYSVTGTSAQGCIATNIAVSSVTVNITPTVSVNSGAICTGESFTMVPTGASTYTYSSGSNVVSPLIDATYNVTGTSAQGCVSSNTAVSAVTVNITPTITVNSGVICTGQSFTMVPSGANTYTYSSGTDIVGPLVLTSYSVTGTSIEGCIATNTAVSTVTVNITPTISVNSGVICTGQSFTMTPSGANTYTYSSGTDVVSPLNLTSYSVTGTSLEGCVGNNTAISTVTVNITPTVSINSGVICSGESFIMVPTGADTYTYSSGTNVVSPLVDATYSVTGTSPEGCISGNTAISSVTVNTTPTVTVNSGVICSGESFTMTPGGADTYTYSSASAVVSPMTDVTYSVTGTSIDGCVSNNTAISSITVNITPTITVNSGVICNGQSFTITPNGADTYTYSGGSNVVSPTADASYTVTGTSIEGCVNTNMAVSSITVNTVPVITVNSGVICSGESFTITPSGADTYTYSSGTDVVSPMSDATYTITGTSMQGCVGTAVAISSVTVNTTPTITVNSGVICSGQSFTMTPSGANTYTYSGGADIVSPMSDATYSVTGTSLQGCVSNNAAISSVTVNITPTVTVNSGTICTGQSFTIIPNGANTYTYSGGSNVVNPMSDATYSITGTSLEGCISTNTAVSSVTVNITPTITVNSGVICSGQSFTIIPAGADTYTYSGGSNMVSPLSDATYSVTGTSIQGCVANNTAISTITVNTTPTIAVNSGMICTGQSFTIVPNGANTYTYSGGSNVVSPMSDATYSVSGTSIEGCVSTNTAISSVMVNITPTLSVNSGSICTGQSFTIIPTGASTYTYSSGTNIVSPMSDATYSVTGTSLQGCVAMNTAISSVTVNTTPTITVNSGVICSGQSFTIIPNGASTYSYSGGSNTVSPLSNNTYSITGTSIEGCLSNNTAISSVTVNVTPTITVNSGAICIGQSFTLTPGGATTYTYSSGSNVVSPGSNASYSVSGTASNGCISATDAVSQVTVNALPNLTIAGTNTICNGSSTTLTANGASTYTWNTGSSNAVISVSPGAITNYTVTGSTGVGCSSTATIDVTVYTNPTVDAGADVEINTGDTYQFNPTQTGAVIYAWSPSNDLNDPSVINPVTSTQSDITYVLTVTSSNGCQASDPVNVKVLSELIFANYMSPNSDGVNDTWKVSVPALIKDYSVEILDSWGKTVFAKSSAYMNEWDGDKLPEGVYYYIIKDGNTLKYKGNITLTR